MRKSTLSHELIFGTRWSMLGLCAALLYVAGCDLIIPPDNNKPRYNSVSGEKRRPPLNPGGAGFVPNSSANKRTAEIDAVYGAPESIQSSASLTTQAAPLAAAPVAAVAAFPPAPKGAENITLQTPRAQPQEEKSMWDSVAFWRDDEPAPKAPAAAPAQEEKSFWSSVAFWRDDEPAAPKVTAEAPRQMPSENRAQLAPVANVPTASVQKNELAPLPGTYPTLSDTPPAPSAAMNDNTRQRLGAAQTELTADRMGAEQDKAALARDVAAQPPIMANVPEWQKKDLSALAPPLPPMNAPVAARAPAVAPITPVAPVSPAPFAQAVPAAAPALEPIRLTPPMAPSLASAEPAPFAAPTASGLEPIRLTPPTAMMTQAPMSQPPALAQGASQIRMAPPRSYAQGAGYLPASRYSQRRY